MHESSNDDAAAAPAQDEAPPARRIALGGADLEKLVNDTVELATPLIKSESARWRRKTSELMLQGADGGAGGGGDGAGDEPDEAKSISQRSFEKSAVSLSINLFIVVFAYMVGSIFHALVGVDIGILIFWLNHLNVLLLFAVDKNAAGVRRFDDPSEFDKLTAGAQVLPLVWLLVTSPRSYWGFVKCIFMQVVLKVVAMTAKSQVVTMLL